MAWEDALHQSQALLLNILLGKSMRPHVKILKMTKLQRMMHVTFSRENTSLFSELSVHLKIGLHDNCDFVVCGYVSIFDKVCNCTRLALTRHFSQLLSLCSKKLFLVLGRLSVVH